MNLKEAKEITGGLSNPSKMPGYGYSLPVKYCRTGSRAYKTPGTVCSQCYARKGRYVFKKVQEAMERRKLSLIHPRWLEAMKVLIEHYCKDVPYFRFHDSGDLQNLFHLDKIVKLCKELPNIKFWLPTLEIEFVKDYFFGDYPEPIPENLNIRISMLMIDCLPDPDFVKEFGGNAITTSSVNTDISTYPKAIICPATLEHGQCGNCRNCWDKSFKHIIYVKH